MSSAPTVVVKKGGVLTALVSGIFGTLIVCILCGAGIGLYALNLADRKVSEFLGSGKTLLQAVPELRGSLSVLSDMLNDQRAPEYRDHLETSLRFAPSQGRRACPLAVLEFTNRGTETVTFLTARVVASDQANVPLHEYRTFAATPVGFDHDEWRGPLLPGTARRFALPLHDCPTDAIPNLSIEITDLRIWCKTPKAELPPQDPAGEPSKPLE